MKRLLEQFPQWVYIVLPLLLSLLAAGLIVQVQRRDDDFRDTQLDLARLQALAYQRHALHDEALVEKHLSVLAAHTGEHANHQADMAIVNLLQKHSRNVLLERVQTAYDTYDTALQDEFDYMLKGDFQTAG